MTSVITWNWQHSSFLQPEFTESHWEVIIKHADLNSNLNGGFPVLKEKELMKYPEHCVNKEVIMERDSLKKGKSSLFVSSSEVPRKELVHVTDPANY